MSGVELRLAARVLTGSPEILSGASHSSGLATGVLTDAMRVQAATGMTSGAEAVRSLGGPFFARFADDMLAKATSVQNGGPTGPAIEIAMDGASWLLRRASHLQ